MLGQSVTIPRVSTGPFAFGGQARGGALPFDRWLSVVTPSYTWTWAYQRYIMQHLERVTSGEIKRLMLFLPPRHGKSEMVTIRYPAWRLECNPSERVIICGYNQILANKFSRRCRKVARERVALSQDRTAVEDWETAEGGGLRAVGVGGGITGQGGNLIIIDDPVKSREEANSQAYRDRVYDWYTDDLYTRLEPGASIILIMTRWHEDDLAGRILASAEGAEWTVIKLPALAEMGDPLGREVGQALCPERYDRGALLAIKKGRERMFTALYQQRPQEQEGGMFKRSWFGEFVNTVPAGARSVRYWDKAATAGGGDYTVGVKMAFSGGVWYVVDVVRGQWSSGERDKTIRQTAELDGKATRVYWEEEGGSSGKDTSVALYKLLAGFSCHADRVTGDKAVRAGPFASQCEGGSVKLVRGAWNAAYIDELCSFPVGAHDDQVDGSSGAFTVLSGGGPVILFGA